MNTIRISCLEESFDVLFGEEQDALVEPDPLPDPVPKHEAAVQHTDFRLEPRDQ